MQENDESIKRGVAASVLAAARRCCGIGKSSARIDREGLGDLWINDAGRRSYHWGLTMLTTVHIIDREGLSDLSSSAQHGLTMLAAVHIIVD